MAQARWRPWTPEGSETSEDGYDDIPRVVVVGEKPRVATSFRKALRYESFLGMDVHWVFTSTRGHVLDLEFKGHLPGWDRWSRRYQVTEQAELFDRPVIEYSIDQRRDEELRRWGSSLQRELIERSLEVHCQDADFVVLCLDNDLEGEAISEEVESIVERLMQPPRFGFDRQIWRCKFSSLDESSLQSAMALPPSGTLQEINRDFVMAVKVRRELDLRLGFAFSRAVKHIVWNYLQNRMDNHDSLTVQKILRLCQLLEESPEDQSGDDDQVHDPSRWPVLSYGPCQLPTLGFVVKNDVDISAFLPQQSWKVRVRCTAGSDELEAWSDPFLQKRDALAEAECLRASTTEPGAQVGGGEEPAPRAESGQLPHGRLWTRRPKRAECAVVVEKRIRADSKKPVALNTPRMLELASDCLGLSPARSLDLAEELYLSGLITYPRSETTAYDPDTDLEAIVGHIASGNEPLVRGLWAAGPRGYAQGLLQDGLEPPRQDGRPLGDHEPVMPAITFHHSHVSAAAADLYDLVVRVFLASVSPDAVIEETTLTLEVPFGGCIRAIGHRVRSLGWIEVLPISEVDDSPLPDQAIQAVLQGSRLSIQDVSVQSFQSAPPLRLKESALLAAMEHHGIGTDASMPGHIEKVIERSYAHVQISENQRRPQGRAAAHVPDNWYREVREMHPTKFGSVLFRWYMLVAPELALPTVRADVEAAYLAISRGVRGAQEVLDEFRESFRNSFWNVFESPGARGFRAMLLGFLKKTDEERMRDSNWRRAERYIQEVNMEEIAQRRNRAAQEAEVASAPAEAPLKNCLMIDAEVLRHTGYDPATRVVARSLEPGDMLAAVAVQRGRLVRGQCSVSRVRVFPMRDRDVATVNVRSTSPVIHASEGGTVRVTSNHALMAKQMGDVSWGPVVARELSPNYTVVLRPTEGHIVRPSYAFHDQEPIPATVVDSRVERASVRVVELEIDSGESAVWLQMAQQASSSAAAQAGCIASYGEFPGVLNTRRRVVALWGFSRNPPRFRQALIESGELRGCRLDLEAAGVSFRLPSGGFLFVRPEEAELVLAALRRRGIAPRGSEVVVSPEFETRLEEALGLISRNENVHRRRLNELRLDAAMGDISYFRNGSPFRYRIDGCLVQGRRTFIEIGEADNSDSERAQTV